MTESNERPRIDIWGSCVSRDTLEYMQDVEVGAYVARQSAIVSLNPAADVDVPYDRLDSEFQKRMIKGDTQADVTDRLKDGPGTVLIDLVDERRGVWQFPSGGFLTNSVEAFKTGIDHWGPSQGARLIDFGTEEHFALWRQGFLLISRHLTQQRVPTILLDVAWAEVADGQRLPRGLRAVGGTIGRRVRRGSKALTRDISRGAPIPTAVRGFISPGLTKREELAADSQRQNRKYRRYVEFAKASATITIHRNPADVRMDPEHKWGLSPYHYRRSDYLSIAEEIRSFLGLQADIKC